MKRTLKNILALVLIILALCSMVLTMVQIQKGINVYDWTIEHVQQILPHESDSAENPSESADPQSSIDEPDEEPLDLPEPTAENPATSARIVEIHQINAEGETQDEPNADDTQAGSETDSPQPPALPDDSQTFDPDASAPELSSSARKLVLIETTESGEIRILGLGWKDVLCFAIESLVLSMVLVYLFMSLFNKKTLKETFKNFDKFLVWLLCTLLFTVLCTGTDIWITRKFFLADSDSQASPMSPLDKPDQKPDDMPDQAPGKPGAPGQPGTPGAPLSEADITWKAATKIDSDTALDYGDYSSDKSDQNTIWIDGVSATLNGGSVRKTGSSDEGDATSFYGINSAVLATNGAEVIMDDMTIETDAAGANGVFSYGTGENIPTKVIISNSNITTSQDQSGGIMTTGGASMQASALQIATYGQSSAAIRTDRGGGTVDVTGGTYTTYGTGSPAVYSTADITVQNATLNSNASEGIVVEGHNSVSLSGCELYDSNTTLNGNSTTFKNIFLYQSMSGDAEEGTARFSADSSSITTNNGDTFYITNTDADITLQGNTILNVDPMGSLLRMEAGPWGSEGHNGAIAHMNLTAQDISGDIHVDGLSELYLNLTDGSSYTGCINQENTARKLQLTLSKDSSIKLTGDCYLDKLTNEDKEWSNIDYNGYTIYVNGKAWNEYNS